MGYQGIHDQTDEQGVTLREPLPEAGIQEPVNDVPVAASGGTTASANTFGPKFLIEPPDPTPEFSDEQRLRLQALTEAKTLLQRRDVRPFGVSPEIDPEDLLLVGHYILTGRWLGEDEPFGGEPIIDEAAEYFAAQDAEGGATVMAQHLCPGDVFTFEHSVGQRWIVLSHPRRTATNERQVVMRVQSTSNPNHPAENWHALAETTVKVFHQASQ